MRKGVVAAFTLVVSSCNKSQPARDAPPLGNSDTRILESQKPEPRDISRVALGDSFKVAHQRILDSGGTVMVGVGFLYLGLGRVEYYELKDGTCLCIRVEAENETLETVRKLTLGAPGRGLKDKNEWINQAHDVNAVELR